MKLNHLESEGHKTFIELRQGGEFNPTVKIKTLIVGNQAITKKNK